MMRVQGNRLVYSKQLLYFLGFDNTRAYLFVKKKTHKICIREYEENMTLTLKFVMA